MKSRGGDGKLKEEEMEGVSILTFNFKEDLFSVVVL